jgi:hypothetical protein
MTYTWNTDLLEIVGENFDVNFVTKVFPADKQFAIFKINLINGTLNKEETKHKRRVLTDEKLDGIGVRLEHKPRKSLKHLAQETGVSTSSTRMATQLLKFGPYKITLIHALQSRDPASRVHFLQLVCTVCRRRWDRSAVDILFWWNVVSLSGIHKYAK